MKHIKKKASLELSINAIVILILAITMLGLGLGFMRNIFGGATDQFEEMTGTVQKQMIDQMKDSGEIVELNRPKITIKAGDKDQIFIGFRNVKQEEEEFSIDEDESSCTPLGADDSCMATSLSGGDYLAIKYKTTPTTVPSGEVTVLPINVETSSNAAAGTYFYDLVIVHGDEDEVEHIELTVDITV